jgi:amino acid adenylation domain-containing protein
MDRHGSSQKRVLAEEKRELLALLLADEGFPMPQAQVIPPREKTRHAPLSFAQQRLWFLDQLEPDRALYHISKAVHLSGVLQVEALQQALDTIVARHEVLRTNIVADDGQPVQVIRAPQTVALPVIDLRGWDDAAHEAELHRRLVAESGRPFNLTCDLMLRALLLRLADEAYVLLLVMHHIASDGWSMGIFTRELSQLYNAAVRGGSAPLPQLPIQYADYALWQRQRLQGEGLEAKLAYWKQHLAGAPAILELPTDRPRQAVQTYRGARQSSTLPPALCTALKTLSQREGVTLFMTLLAAFQTLLYRYTGRDDIVVGSPIAGRTQGETEGLIGFFVNTLVLRTDLAGNPSFRALLHRVRETSLGAYAHQELPFEKLVEELQPERTLSHAPLFQLIFSLQNFPRETLELTGLTLQSMQIEREAAKFDLSLMVVEGGAGLRARLAYNSDLFESATMVRLLGHFQTLLESIVAAPDTPISRLPLLTAAEQQQVLVAWNDTQGDYPADACIHELFEAQVERTPDAVAVRFEDQQLTYRALNGRGNQVAHHLRKLGVGPEVLVGICMERSLEMVIGLLGILKAGAAYVPLDPTQPKERVAFMLEDAQIQVLLTQQKLVGELPDYNRILVCLDSDWEMIAQESEQNPVSGSTADNLAYVMYTSGSTGRPKGVMIAHRPISNHLFWFQKSYPLTKADRVLQRSSFGFDPSVREFFWPLMASAQLILVHPDRHYDSAYFVKLIAEQKITVARFDLSMLQALLEEQGFEACKSLRRVICGGEPVPMELQERFFSRLDVALHNAYGPTETCISVTVWTCKRDSHHRTVPIGSPIMNIQVYLLDAHLQPVPIGVAGELYIGGAGLARGYRNHPELTAEQFIPNPFSDEPGARLYKTGDLARYLSDGNIEFLGRIDEQLKIRGVRIEPREIEAVLGQHPAVREVVVLAREDRRGDKRLVAYIVPAPGISLIDTELRGFLRTKLPEYMVPSAYVVLDTLPLTPNGKVDRRALPAPDWARTELEASFVAPRTPMESLIAEIWKEVLRVEQVSVYDNFFDIGGHSLLAMQVIARLEKRLGLWVPPRELIMQTLGQLASSCEARLSQNHQAEPPSFTQKIWRAAKSIVQGLRGERS